MDQRTRDIPLLGRIELAREPDFVVGGLEVRPSRCEVESEGRTETLQRRVMQVLVALCRGGGEVVSQQDLVVRCWDGLTVSDDAIGRCIGQLRRLAALWPAPPFSIDNIHGVGYRLTPASAVKIDPPARAAPADIGAGRAVPFRAAWAGAAAVALAAVAGGVWMTARPAETSGRVSVLPLEVLSGGQEGQVLAQSISSEIVGVLGDHQIAAVLGRGGQAAAPGAAFLVEGSVRQDPQQTHVAVRLEDAQTRNALWSGDFSQSNAELTDLQSEVSARVADLIGIAEYARVGSRTPVKEDPSLSAVLEFADLIRGNRGPDAWARMLMAARREVASAPDFALGHADLAIAEAGAALEEPAQRRTLIAEAVRDARRALEIDPHNAAGYYALQLLAPYNAFAAREAILAIGLKHATGPSGPLAALNTTRGEELVQAGRLSEALPLLQLGLAGDPMSPWKSFALIRALEDDGRQAEAAEALGKALQQWPHHAGIVALHWYSVAFYGSATDQDRLLAGPSDPTPGIWRAYILARRTPTPGLVDRAARLAVDGGRQGLIFRGAAIMILASLGRVDEAFDLADAFRREVGSVDPSFMFTPAARSMRRDPRFMQLAARFGLVDYWRATGKWPDICAGPRPELDCRAALVAAGV